MHYNYGDSFGFALSKAASAMKNRFHQVLRAYKVTPEQTVVLLRLSETEGVSPTVLAEAIAKDKPNTVRIIDKLMQKGLVFSAESVKDKRSYLIFLTKEGTRLKEQLIPIAEDLKKRALTGFLPEEVERFKFFLRKTYDNLR